MARAVRWLPLAAVVALLGAAMFAALFANPRIDYLPADPLPTGGPPSQASAPTASPEEILPTPPVQLVDSWSLPGWLSWLLTGVCAAAVVAIILILFWMLLRERLLERRARLAVERDAAPFAAPTQEQVRAAVAEGLADLDDADADPRRAVIACWVRLEQAAAAAGIAREIGDTSTDLVARLLRTHSVSRSVLDGFAAVYREARYATHTVDVGMREQAQAALRQLRDELSVGVL